MAKTLNGTLFLSIESYMKNKNFRFNSVFFHKIYRTIYDYDEAKVNLSTNVLKGCKMHLVIPGLADHS